MSIKARGLEDYITGIKTQKPVAGDVQARQWEIENSLVMCWVIIARDITIAKGYLLLDIAREIWSVASQTYSQVGHDAQIFEIRKKVYETKQGEWLIFQYHIELNSLWQELDYYQDFQVECPNDASKIQTMIDKERVFDFWLG